MPGQGKREGWRSLLGFQAGSKAFFLYLFPKSRRDNINAAEMKVLKRLTKYYLVLKPAEIKAALKCGELRAHSKITSHFRISASSHLQLLINREILEIAHYFCGFTQSQQLNLT